MSCPICGSININFQNGEQYCPRCRRVISERDTVGLLAIIEAALATCDGRCCDVAQDRAEIAEVVAKAVRAAQGAK